MDSESLEKLIQKVFEYGALYGMNVLAAILIFIVGKFVASIVTNLLEKVLIKAKVEKTLVSFLKNLTNAALLVFVVIAAINKLGVETTSLVALLGAAGLAVGLALQGSLSNFAAGIVLIIFKPYKIGDLIEAAGALGNVKQVQVFNTVLSTLDHRIVIVPNSKITSDNIINYSSMKERRIDMVFGISYTDDLKKAKEVLIDVCKKESRVLDSPETVVAVSELGDSSVNLVCRPWVRPADYWDVLFAITENGKLELEANGMTIPFPQRDVHIYEESLKQ